MVAESDPCTLVAPRLIGHLAPSLSRDKSPLPRETNTTQSVISFLFRPPSKILSVVQPCFPADAPGLTATMMGARLTHPHFVILWEDPSSEDIIAKATNWVP